MYKKGVRRLLGAFRKRRERPSAEYKGDLGSAHSCTLKQRDVVVLQRNDFVNICT